MKRRSGIKRLAMGLGVVALGVLGALPFRHPRPTGLADTTDVLQSPAALGEGVALQVPGQTAVPRFDASHLVPLPAEDERDETVVEDTEQSAMFTISRPPQLPDQYQPLFHPEAARQQHTGRVVASATAPTSAPKRVKRHTIHDGDTLESLAQRFLGDPARAKDILDANRSVLDDPEVLPIGVEIVVPLEPVDAAPSDPAASSDPAARSLVPLPAQPFRRSG